MEQSQGCRTSGVRAFLDGETLRGRGLVAEESAGADGVARVLVITPSTARLAEQVCVAGDGQVWFWWSDEPLCPADDIDTPADKIAHLLAP